MKMKKTLHISGQGRINVIPEVVVIEFTVESMDFEYERSIEHLNKKVQSLRDIVVRNGLERPWLRTKNFVINKQTQLDKRTETEHFMGFRSSEEVTITFPYEVSVVKSLLSDVSKEFRDVDFHLCFKPCDSVKCRSAALEQAIENASRMAALIAEKSAILLGDIQNIEYSFTPMDITTKRLDLCLMKESNLMNADIEPEEIEVTETVQMSWAIKDKK